MDCECECVREKLYLTGNISEFKHIGDVLQTLDFPHVDSSQTLIHTAKVIPHPSEGQRARCD